jgi:hypothetical protein
MFYNTVSRNWGFVNPFTAGQKATTLQADDLKKSGSEMSPSWKPEYNWDKSRHKEVQIANENCLKQREGNEAGDQVPAKKISQV